MTPMDRRTAEKIKTGLAAVLIVLVSIGVTAWSVWSIATDIAEIW